jgi:hypothetical protein
LIELSLDIGDDLTQGIEVGLGQIGLFSLIDDAQQEDDPVVWEIDVVNPVAAALPSARVRLREPQFAEAVRPGNDGRTTGGSHDEDLQGPEIVIIEL